MKTILCFGDSNTWGSISQRSASPGPAKRFDEQTRWGSVLRNHLGEDNRVIEEGLGGRTTVYATKDEQFKNGESYLFPCLLSHRPLSLVIMMLGTNDLRQVFGVTEETLGDGISRLVDIIQANPQVGDGAVAPKILLISPVAVAKPEGRDDFYVARGSERAERLSALFPKAYAAVAARKGCDFMNAQDYAKPDVADGLHMDAASHIALGNAVARRVRALLSD